jgi:hypothetical protein
VLYYGSNKVYRSDNNAIYWNTISEDLTNGLHESGSLSYGTLTCIAPSYNNLDVIYTGSDDGNVSVTFNGGATWQSVDDDLPNRFVTQIAIHPDDDQTAYVTFSGFKALDYTPHIFKTTDAGVSWVDISSNLPSVPINDVIVTASNNYLYIATDTAVWYSVNQGELWEILGNNLQIGIVADIKFHEPTNTLYAGTFGRSIYNIDLEHITSTEKLSVNSESLFTVFPNPINTEFNIKVNASIDKEIYVFITDMQGKIVQDFGKYNFENTNQKLNFKLKNIASGMYTIHINSDLINSSTKVVVEQ